MPSRRPDPTPLTPLMRAARKGALPEVFELVVDGVEIDTKDDRGWTALSYACYQGHYEIARQLLDSGAEVDPQESYSSWDSPLSLAAGHGHFDLVRLLIAHGANPNLYAGAVMIRAEAYARYAGHHAISEFLLYHEDRR